MPRRYRTTEATPSFFMLPYFIERATPSAASVGRAPVSFKAQFLLAFMPLLAAIIICATLNLSGGAALAVIVGCYVVGAALFATSGEGKKIRAYLK